MRAGGLDFPGQVHVVRQIVAFAALVQDVARIAEADLGDLALLAHGVDRHLHVRHPVHGVEDSEDIDSGVRCLLHEHLHRVVRVGRVAHETLAPEKHLKQDMGNLFAKLREAPPRILSQKTIGSVERRTSPDLHGKEVGC